jgi:hypothetical protein
MAEDMEADTGTAGADIPAVTRAEGTEDMLVTAVGMSGAAILVALTRGAQGTSVVGRTSAAVTQESFVGLSVTER